MPKTAGQKLGSLLVPLFLLAILAGAVTGAGAGAVLSVISAVQSAVQPELGMGPGGFGIFPVLVGLPAGAMMSLAPAAGSAVALFVQAWNAPFPSVKEQTRAAAWGACSATVLLTTGALLWRGADPVAILAAGTAYALVSFLLAFFLTARLLRHLEAADAGAN